tara:strand:- start:273 stop:395 length:123 start_codon:yes stop_codon:yes gene_type:complete
MVALASIRVWCEELSEEMRVLKAAYRKRRNNELKGRADQE